MGPVVVVVVVVAAAVNAVVAVVVVDCVGCDDCDDGDAVARCSSAEALSGRPLCREPGSNRPFVGSNPSFRGKTLTFK